LLNTFRSPSGFFPGSPCHACRFLTGRDSWFPWFIGRSPKHRTLDLDFDLGLAEGASISKSSAWSLHWILHPRLTVVTKPPASGSRDERSPLFQKGAFQVFFWRRQPVSCLALLHEATPFICLSEGDLRRFPIRFTFKFLPPFRFGTEGHPEQSPQTTCPMSTCLGSSFCSISGARWAVVPVSSVRRNRGATPVYLQACSFTGSGPCVLVSSGLQGC